MWRHQPRLTQFEYGQCKSAVNRENERANLKRIDCGIGYAIASASASASVACGSGCGGALAIFILLKIRQRCKIRSAKILDCD